MGLTITFTTKKGSTQFLGNGNKEKEERRENIHEREIGGVVEQGK
jgi:hypothetical protein